MCRISNLLLQYIIILPITLHLATFGGILILKAQFSKHVITVVDTKLLLLNQSWPQVVCDSCSCANGPVNYHRGAMRGTVEMPKLLPLCTPLYPLRPIWELTLRHVLGVGQAWWYTSTALIAARMLNYAVRDPWKTNRPYWLIWHPREGRTFTRAYPIRYICFVRIALMHGVLFQSFGYQSLLKWWNVLWVHEQCMISFILVQLNVKKSIK